MKTKKIPMRLCIGCGEMKPKKDLIRVLKDAEGTIQLDFTGKNPDGAHTYVRVWNALPQRRRGTGWNARSAAASQKRFMRR